MEGDNVQAVEDNCSQIEKAFKRMKVGTSRCNKKSHQIYQTSQYQHQQQLLSPPTRQITVQEHQQQHEILHPDHHLLLSTNNQISSNSTNRVNHNQNNSSHHLNQSNEDNINSKCEDGPPTEPDVSVEELAAYLDVQLYIPRKMSYMAELMYT